MKTLRHAFAVPVLALTALLAATPSAPAEDIDFDNYAAIAYSPSTGKFGYAWNYGTSWTAARRALAECKAPDARIVGSVNAGWVVLAVGDDNSYGVAVGQGYGADLRALRRQAIAACKAKGAGKVVKLVYVCSGHYKPIVAG